MKNRRINYFLLSVFIATTAASEADAFAADGRLQLVVTPRIGLAFPGTMTPREVVNTDLGFGFATTNDATMVFADRFEAGLYFHYSLRPINSRGTAPVDGLLTHLVSIGAVAKFRLELSSTSRLGFGAMVGYNREWQDFKNSTFEGTITGNGLNISPSVEWSLDVAPKIALNVQIGFISQVAGEADLGSLGAVVANGSEQTMTFPPLAFLTVGTELAL